MPDRPHDPANPTDGPEYDWLYGGRSHPPAPESDASSTAGGGVDSEHTRVLPTAPRPATGSTAATPSPAGRPVPPTVPPTMPPPIQTGGRGWRPRIPRLRVLIPVVIVLWLIFLIAVPFWAWSKVDKINALPKGGPADQPGTNYLLVGSDSREGLTKAENRKLGTGGVGVDGGRTDTIMILHT
ncbi:MAG TPA: hypothetical protein VF426_11455, partial [Marmoricola sp.]